VRIDKAKEEEKAEMEVEERVMQHEIMAGQAHDGLMEVNESMCSRRLLNIVGYSTSSVTQHRQPCPQSK
jgi:hypothetical protein